MNYTVHESLPPAKRRKSETKEVTLLLNSIPKKEAFDNLLRCFSDMPNTSKWETHIEVGDVLELLAVHGEFGSFIKSQFTTLCVSKTKYCDGKMCCFSWKLRNEQHLWMDNIDVALKFILAGGGESLQNAGHRVRYIRQGFWRWYSWRTS